MVGHQCAYQGQLSLQEQLSLQHYPSEGLSDKPNMMCVGSLRAVGSTTSDAVMKIDVDTLKIPRYMVSSENETHFAYNAAVPCDAEVLLVSRSSLRPMFQRRPAWLPLQCFSTEALSPRVPSPPFALMWQAIMACLIVWVFRCKRTSPCGQCIVSLYTAVRHWGAVRNFDH